MSAGKDIARLVGRMTRKLRGQMRGLVRRGTVGPLKTDSGMQTLQAKTTAKDVDDDVELFEQQGFTCGPAAGAECLVFNVGGTRSHRVALAASDRNARPTDLGREEPCMYHRNGARIVIREDGSIEVYPAEGQVVRLGGEGGLPVARQTDPVHREAAMVAWMTQVTAAINVMGPSFNAVAATPVVALGPASVAPVVAFAVEPFARINAGGVGSEST